MWHPEMVSSIPECSFGIEQILPPKRLPRKLKKLRKKQHAAMMRYSVDVVLDFTCYYSEDLLTHDFLLTLTQETPQ